MSNNTSPGWGLYYADVASANNRAAKSEEAANEWEKYAKRLEKKLEEQWKAFRDESGNATGQRAIKDALTNELRQLDPSNQYLDTDLRASIFDKAKDNELRRIDSVK